MSAFSVHVDKKNAFFYFSAAAGLLHLHHDVFNYMKKGLWPVTKNISQGVVVA